MNFIIPTIKNITPPKPNIAEANASAPYDTYKIFDSTKKANTNKITKNTPPNINQLFELFFFILPV